MVPPPPSTPARRFIANRPAASSQRTPASRFQHLGTPASRFQAIGTPRAGTQQPVEDVDDVESDAGSEDLSDEEAPRVPPSDDIYQSSAEHDEHYPSSPKRRRLEEESLEKEEEQSREVDARGSPELGLLDNAEAEPGRDSPSTAESETESESDNLGDVAANTAQPVFRPAPRFKPVHEDDDGDALPPSIGQLSPTRKRGYVPGGMAEELQSWLSEVKGLADDDGSGRHDFMRLSVDEARIGSRMCLARSDDGGQYLLAGAAPGDLAGRTVRVRRPVWDVPLGDETWTVVCNWAVDE